MVACIPATGHVIPDEPKGEKEKPARRRLHQEFEEEVHDGDRSTWTSSESPPPTGWSTQEQQSTPNTTRRKDPQETTEEQELPPRPDEPDLERLPLEQWVDRETMVEVEMWLPAAQLQDM